MNPLQTELQRLYAPSTDAQDQVRAARLTLARPADWAALGSVWRGVQADLELPAPAIAVNGLDGIELWFSFAQALAPEQALAFVEALRRRYLTDIGGERLGLAVGAGDALPPRQIQQLEQWSAFVAPDLAPVFGAEPWLDIAPNPDGQADLLARLASIQGVDLRRALERLGVSSAPVPVPVLTAEPDPRAFLLRVMQDESVALALRIEAAKALLQAKK
jgi:hypothetical protein